MNYIRVNADSVPASNRWLLDEPDLVTGQEHGKARIYLPLTDGQTRTLCRNCVWTASDETLLGLGKCDWFAGQRKWTPRGFTRLTACKEAEVKR